MSAEKAHLLGLIGLRALAEMDPAEYRRVADLSKRNLDQRIGTLLKAVADQECESLYAKITGLASFEEALPATENLLRYVYLASTLGSQYESLAAAHAEPFPSDIIREEIRNAGLSWSPDAAESLATNLEALDSNMVADFQGQVIGILGQILQELSQNPGVAKHPGADEVIWNICSRVLSMVKLRLSPTASAANLWDAAKDNTMEAWLYHHTVKPTEKLPQKTRSRRRKSL